MKSPNDKGAALRGNDSNTLKIYIIQYIKTFMCDLSVVCNSQSFSVHE